MAFRVRHADPSDLDAIMEIWRAGIENSLGAPPSDTTDYRAYYAARIEEQDENFKFFLVENGEGRVVAWQSVMPFRNNPATRDTMGEMSVYTHPDYAGKATLVGLRSLFEHADKSGLHFLLAFIAKPNAAAIKLANYFRLEHVTTLPTSAKAPHLPSLGLFVYTCRALDAQVEDEEPSVFLEESFEGLVEQAEIVDPPPVVDPH